MEALNNCAFIDGQNLQYNTKNAQNPWSVDLRRFRIYLHDKYSVDKAYYFLGAMRDEYSDLYQNIQEAGFVLMFREHNASMIGKKKGNVDTDIVFTVMKMVNEDKNLDKVFLVSGDGDYIRMVDYLISLGKFGKLLAPTRVATSSLYLQHLDNSLYDFLDKKDIKRKIEYHKKATSS